MPRDGSQIYHRPPGTDGIPDTTIESTKYNINVADVEQDLNLPRPIIAGGTGANNSRDARAAVVQSLVSRGMLGASANVIGKRRNQPL